MTSESALDGYPHGPTDFDDDDVILERLANGAATVVPRSLRKLDDETKLDVAELMRCVATINELDDAIAGLVGHLRGRGLSWAGIGWAVGTTGDAARKRWGMPTDDAR